MFVPVVASEEVVNKLWDAIEANPNLEITVSVKDKTWSTSDGDTHSFDLDDFLQYRLINGLDDIGITLINEDKITKFEKTRPAWLPKFN